MFIWIVGNLLRCRAEGHIQHDEVRIARARVARHERYEQRVCMRWWTCPFFVVARVYHALCHKPSAEQTTKCEYIYIYTLCADGGRVSLQGKDTSLHGGA